MIADEKKLKFHSVYYYLIFIYMIGICGNLGRIIASFKTPLYFDNAFTFSDYGLNYKGVLYYDILTQIISFIAFLFLSFSLKKRKNASWWVVISVNIHIILSNGVIALYLLELPTDFYKIRFFGALIWNGFVLAYYIRRMPLFGFGDLNNNISLAEDDNNEDELVVTNNQTEIDNNNLKINYCRKCGAKLVSDALFCNKCGYRLDNTCSHCGKVIPDESKFCPFCGLKKK